MSCGSSHENQLMLLQKTHICRETAVDAVLRSSVGLTTGDYDVDIVIADSEANVSKQFSFRSRGASTWSPRPTTTTTSSCSWYAIPSMRAILNSQRPSRQRFSCYRPSRGGLLCGDSEPSPSHSEEREKEEETVVAAGRMRDRAADKDREKGAEKEGSKGVEGQPSMFPPHLFLFQTIYHVSSGRQVPHDHAESRECANAVEMQLAYERMMIDKMPGTISIFEKQK